MVASGPLGQGLDLRPVICPVIASLSAHTPPRTPWFAPPPFSSLPGVAAGVVEGAALDLGPRAAAVQL